MQLPRSLDEQRAMMTFGMVEPLPADRRPKPIGAFVLPTPIDADRFFIRATHERGVGVIMGTTISDDMQRVWQGTTDPSVRIAACSAALRHRT